MPRVTYIPATVDPLTGMQKNAAAKRRVAGYARVSTDKDEQFTSYEAQVDYYTRFIMAHPGWEFVKVYTDEGISGLGTAKREGFNEMIGDALAGRIDLIVTKSVSRFARNTVDSLVTIRKLKEKGVEVYFEKENIYSLDGKGELLLTIMSSLAQEESRSISENVTWGQRKRFADGKVSLPYKQFLGYERGKNKGDPPVINREQAETVRRIYKMFMNGKTPGAIAKKLTEEKIPTPGGRTVWRDSTVSSILQNEKYRGAALLQKGFTVDFLTKKRKKNEGEVPQYYIEDSHEAIIDPEEWQAVQDEIARRKVIGRAYSGSSVFGAKIICADCGAWYGSKVWHSTDKYKSRIWQCNSKFNSIKPECGTPHLKEKDIQDRFLAVFNRMITDKAANLAACGETKAVLTDVSGIDDELNELRGEMDVIEELIRKCVEQNSKETQDQEAFLDRYRGYVKKYEKVQVRQQSLLKERAERKAKAAAIDRFAAELQSRDGLLEDFDNEIWLLTVESVTAHGDGSLTFRFYGGTEVVG